MLILALICEHLYLNLFICYSLSLALFHVLCLVPCPPSGLTGVTTCANNDITVSWDQSPESHTTYLIHSYEDGASADYTTTQTSYLLTGLQCGELYMLAVAVNDSQCTSNFSEPIQTETG